MSKKEQSNNNISGEGVALAFVGIGLLWAYLLSQIFGTLTPYIAAAFILFGFAGFMVSLQGRFKDNSLRWTNGGVGLIVGVVPGWLMFVAYNGLHGFWRGLVCLVLSAVLLIGAAAIIDFVVSIFEYFVQQKANLTGKLTGLVKFIALIVSTAAAVYATLSQVIK